ncbi:uncharacterized protein LOC134219877 [Armigeres subalbatus]|uniref:uncharacterized protein LOC134219877 n=1 Tax=Armigeres subalbatus TaxID=124917 RepID=UPI002ED485CA
MSRFLPLSVFLFGSILFNSATSNVLNCTECSSVVSWADCSNGGRVTQCTTELVNALHSQLRIGNPNLPIGNYSEFKCFKIKVSISNATVPNVGTEYLQGCTFQSAKFCSGWRNVTVLECSGAAALRFTAGLFVLMVVGILVVYDWK